MVGACVYIFILLFYLVVALMFVSLLDNSVILKFSLNPRL